MQLSIIFLQLIYHFFCNLLIAGAYVKCIRYSGGCSKL